MLYFPWILLGIELYFKNKNIVNLLAISPLLAVIATSKGTVFVLTVSGIFYIYFKKILKAKYLDLGIAFLIFLIMSYLLYQENLKVNNVSMLSHPELESYLFRAPLSFIYTLNLNDLFSNPFRNVHAGSLFGITAIDLFGDYFNRYWDHERSLFISNRKTSYNFFRLSKKKYLSNIINNIFYFYIYKTKIF